MFSIRGEDVRLMLWDTAGQEEFDCITRAYYRYRAVDPDALVGSSSGLAFRKRSDHDLYFI